MRNTKEKVEKVLKFLNKVCKIISRIFAIAFIIFWFYLPEGENVLKAIAGVALIATLIEGIVTSITIHIKELQQQTIIMKLSCDEYKRVRLKRSKWEEDQLKCEIYALRVGSDLMLKINGKYYDVSADEVEIVEVFDD